MSEDMSWLIPGLKETNTYWLMIGNFLDFKFVVIAESLAPHPEKPHAHYPQDLGIFVFDATPDVFKWRRAKLSEIISWMAWCDNKTRKRVCKCGCDISVHKYADSINTGCTKCHCAKFEEKT